MSVINQMLKDLEQRRAAEQEKRGLPNLVRPLPSIVALPSQTIWIAILATIGLIVLALTIWWAVVNGKNGKNRNRVNEAPAIALLPATAPMQSASTLNTIALNQDKFIKLAHFPSLPLSLPLSQKSKQVPSKREVTKTRSIIIEMGAPLEKTVKEDSKKTEPEDREIVKATAWVLAAADQTSSLSKTDAVIIDKKLREPTPEQRAENEYRHAITLIDKARIFEAMERLKNALKNNPQHHAAREILVGLLLDARRTEEAQTLLQDALEQNVNQPRVALLLARLLVDKGNLEEAWRVLSKTLPVAEEADYHAFSAGVLQRLQRHQDAVVEYQYALRQVPDSGVWWMGLGISLQALDKPIDAKEAFKNAQSTAKLSPELQQFVQEKLRQLSFFAERKN